MSDIDKPFPGDDEATLTIRMIMNGKEVGSIIGKGGEIINSIREESGAKIHISDGSVPERIVTVTGSTDAINKGFTMICKKMEEDGPRDGSSRDSSSSSSSRPPVTLRLIVPASQCGSLIGKGGSKIKEIREVTGASIQVASEMLPGSTERAVTVSGTQEAISACIYNVCLVMLESPAKGMPVPYCPKGGLLGAGGGYRGGGGGRGGGGQQDNPLASLLGLGGGGSSALAALASLAGSQIRADRRGDGRRDHDRDGGSSSQTYEMSIPNELIGCIIGKGGSKIAEIRQISGAMIRISKSDEGDDDSAERQINISGNADSVALAKSLINMSLDLHKSKMDDRERGDRGDSRGDNRGDSRGGRYNNGGNDMGGLAHLLKPEALTNALTTLATFGGLGGLSAGLLGNLGGGHGGGMGQVTGVHRSRGGYGNGSRGNREDDRRESKRSKFAPY